MVVDMNRLWEGDKMKLDKWINTWDASAQESVIDILGMDSEDLPEKLLKIESILIKKIVALGISRNPNHITNIIECVLIWHSDWLWEHLDSDIQEHWELAIWISQVQSNPNFMTLKGDIGDIEAIVVDLDVAEKQQLSNHIINDFRANKITMNPVLNLWEGNLFQNNRVDQDQISYNRFS